MSQTLATFALRASYDARRATFDGVPAPSASNTTTTGRRKAASKDVTLAWPHPVPSSSAKGRARSNAYPSPADLATAGFYFCPDEATESDRCAHFLPTDGAEEVDIFVEAWHEGDDALERLEREDPRSAWLAIHRSRANYTKSDTARSSQPDGSELDLFVWREKRWLPDGEEMTKARLATFGDAWPYDGKKGWRPTSKRLAEAGFHYTPSSEEADNATCIYCEKALGGWEKGDDPFEEHRRRKPHCPFFNCTLEEDPSEDESEEPVSHPTRTTSGSKSRRNISAAYTSSAKRRGKVTEEEEEENDGEEEESNEGTAKQSRRVASTRAPRKGKAVLSDDEEQQEPDNDDEAPAEEEPEQPRRRGKARLPTTSSAPVARKASTRVASRRAAAKSTAASEDEEGEGRQDEEATETAARRTRNQRTAKADSTTTAAVAAPPEAEAEAEAPQSSTSDATMIERPEAEDDVGVEVVIDVEADRTAAMEEDKAEEERRSQSSSRARAAKAANSSRSDVSTSSSSRTGVKQGHQKEDATDEVADQPKRRGRGAAAKKDYGNTTTADASTSRDAAAKEVQAALDKLAKAEAEDEAEEKARKDKEEEEEAAAASKKKAKGGSSDSAAPPLEAVAKPAPDSSSAVSVPPIPAGLFGSSSSPRPVAPLPKRTSTARRTLAPDGAAPRSRLEPLEALSTLTDAQLNQSLDEWLRQEVEGVVGLLERQGNENIDRLKREMGEARAEIENSLRGRAK